MLRKLIENIFKGHQKRKNKITTQDLESAVEKYWQLLIKSLGVSDRFIYPTVNLTYLLGCLIDISHTTQRKRNSWNLSQENFTLVFAISVNSNSILLAAQAKNLGFILEASVYPTPLMSLVRKSFWFYVVDPVMYHRDPPQDRRICFPSYYEWC